MRAYYSVAATMLLFGCSGTSPEPQPVAPERGGAADVVLLIEHPRDPKVALRHLLINVRNDSPNEIKYLNYPQSFVMEQLKVSAQDHEGKHLELTDPYDVGVPTKPSEKDYTKVKPGESAKFVFDLSPLRRAYGLKPSQLYFVTLELQVSDDKGWARVTFPYGYLPFSKTK